MGLGGLVFLHGLVVYITGILESKNARLGNLNRMAQFGFEVGLCPCGQVGVGQASGRKIIYMASKRIDGNNLNDAKGAASCYQNEEK